ncbi:hypothetical protein [Pontibacter sp. SGAir0037]|uniref:hypothetical protein n=1 Tax=Pontibacter sp. SGAir0037 TaxID=2571030 RepID=UPI0010CCDD7F|nr:hypothetical protein [Pontibacter sp. SGAir0037]QCR21468.1 hypothetical protein C1N53_03310 [Pontibacter sp. SGAir0037]
MKTFLFSFFLVLSFATVSFSQDLQQKSTTLTNIRASSLNGEQPLVFIDSLATKINHLVIKPSQIEVLKIYKGASALKIFGEKGENGVVLVELKKDIPLQRLNKVYDHFKVSQANRKLKVLLNKSLLVDQQFFLADLSQIEKIEVTKLDATSPRKWSFNEDESYLNIVTVKE